MSKYVIRVIESDEEIEESAQHIVESFKAGYMFIMAPDGERDLEPDEVAAMSEADLLDAAYDYMGDEWGVLWVYSDNSDGLDPEPAQVFDTPAEAEAMIATKIANGSRSTYEIVERN